MPAEGEEPTTAPTTSARVFARAGLLGNPSDGYGGAAIGFTFDAMSVEVRCTRTAAPGLRFRWHDELLLDAPDIPSALAIPPTSPDHGALRLFLASLHRLDGSVDGGIATLIDRDGPPRAPGLALDGSTTIPTQVGLAGSSAIVLATMRCLLALGQREVDPDRLAELALMAESELLGIAAGPLDRIAQARNGLHFMDFAADRAAVTPIEVTDWPSLFLAWSTTPGESSGVVHSDLRERFDRRDPDIVTAIARFAEIAREGRDALTAGDHGRLGDLFDENFALRRRIVSASERDEAMVAIAQSAAASAKQCGSGGAIIGIGRDPDHLAQLRQRFERAGYGFLEPQLVLATASATDRTAAGEAERR